MLEALKAMGLKVLRIQPIGEAKHIFSHREWHMKGYAVRVDELESSSSAAGKAAGYLSIKGSAGKLSNSCRLCCLCKISGY